MALCPKKLQVLCALNLHGHLHAEQLRRLVLCIQREEDAPQTQQELFTTFQEELTSIALVQGTGGIYDIYLNDVLLFSRKQESRFPEIKELKQLVRDRINPERDLGHIEGHHSVKD